MLVAAVMALCWSAAPTSQPLETAGESRLPDVLAILRALPPDMMLRLECNLVRVEPGILGWMPLGQELRERGDGPGEPTEVEMAALGRRKQLGTPRVT
jgi:hypothetical protein